MNDRLEEATSVAQKIQMPWDSAQIERSLGRLKRKQRRRRIAQGTAVVVVLLGGGLLLPQWLPQENVASALASDSTRVLSFTDGSLAKLSSEAKARIKIDSPSTVEVELQEGKVVFDVVHSKNRLFVVRAGSVYITDLGTVFSVERVSGRVHVAVSAGKVRVDAQGISTELVAGESRWFSEEIEKATEKVIEAAKPVLKNTATRKEIETKPSSTLTPVDVVEQLYLSADTLRLERRTDEAISVLQQIVATYPQDKRSAMAAFTLGKLHFENGRALDAAEAYLRTQTLAPEGPLFEDAMGRELEARVQAKDVVRAQKVAEQYLKRFPQGVRAELASQILGSFR